MASGFADSDGPLLSRLRILVLDVVCIAAGAGLGFVSRNDDAVPPFRIWRRPSWTAWSTSLPVPLLRNAATALRRGTARDRIDGRVNGGAVGIAGRLVR
jgi:hypothetical protein